jgi:hypothetical protein
MPKCGCQALLHESGDVFLVSIAMDNVEAWMATNGARHRLVVWLAKVVHEFLLHCRPSVDEILVGQHNHLSLSNEVGEFIFGLVG